jgi:hypothetical protein
VDPENVKALSRRATALQNIGRRFEAVKDAERAVELDSSNQDVQKQLR